MDQREALIAERDGLTVELETLGEILRAGKKGRFGRILSLAYGTGGREAFETESRHRAFEDRVELLCSQKRAVEQTILTFQQS